MRDGYPFLLVSFTPVTSSGLSSSFFHVHIFLPFAVYSSLLYATMFNTHHSLEISFSLYFSPLT